MTSSKNNISIFNVHRCIGLPICDMGFKEAHSVLKFSKMSHFTSIFFSDCMANFLNIWIFPPKSSKNSICKMRLFELCSNTTFRLRKLTDENVRESTRLLARLGYNNEINFSPPPKKSLAVNRNLYWSDLRILGEDLFWASAGWS